MESGTKFPPSLRNIFKELVEDVKCPEPTSGDLSKWAKQGVLLLNTTLTVKASQPMSTQEWDGSCLRMLSLNL